MVFQFTRGEVLTIGKAVLENAAIASRLNLPELLGNKTRSEILTDREIADSQMYALYEDPAAFILNNQVGLEGEFPGLGKVVGVEPADVQGSFITWLAEQRYLQIGVELEQRSLPMREVVYLDKPGEMQKIIYSDGSGVVVTDVNTIFPDFTETDKIIICKGGVVIRSFYSDSGNGSVWEIAKYEKGKYQIVDFTQHFEHPNYHNPPRYFGEQVVSWDEVVGQEKSKEVNQLLNEYFISSSYNLVKLEQRDHSFQARVISPDNYPPIEIANEYKSIKYLPTISGWEFDNNGIMQFRDYVASFVIQAESSDVPAQFSFVFTNGSKRVVLPLEMDINKMERASKEYGLMGYQIDYSSNLLEIERILVDQNIDLKVVFGMVMISELSEDPNWSPMPTPWIIVGMNRARQIQIIETEESKKFLYGNPSDGVYPPFRVPAEA